jgi:neutral ceramidase
MADVSKGTLLAGAAKEDITPPIGTKTNYGIATQIDLPLYTQALVLADGDMTVGISTSDVLYTHLDVVSDARKSIEDKTGIPGANILFCASHTHEGPAIEGPYRNVYLNKVVNAVCRAWDARVAARVGAAKGAVVGVHINRRNPYGPADPDVGVLRVDHLNGDPLALLFNFAMHGVVLGHKQYQGVSPDWIGHATKHIEELQGDGTVALFMQGPSGNINPYTSYGYTGFTDRGGTVQDAERIGALFGLLTVTIAAQIQTASSIRLSRATAYKRLWEERSFDQVERYRRVLEQKKTRLRLLKKREGSPEQVARLEKILAFMEKYYDRVFTGRPRQRTDHPAEAEIQVLGINDARIAGVGGECFTEYALYIKDKALKQGYNTVFIAELANGAWQSYIPTEVAYTDEYGYEAFSAEILGGLSPTAGQLIADTVVGLIATCGNPVEPPPKPFSKMYLPKEAYAVKPLIESRLDRLLESLPYHHELRARKTEIIRDLP